MIDGQSEQLNHIKKAMKKHEILSSDKAEFAACKNDLMKKIAMEDGDASEIANSIRDLFLPKLLKSEGIEKEEMPSDFIGKMTGDDDDFENEQNTEEHGFEDHENEEFNDESEEDANEIATIHITVPADKIREVEQALETVLGDGAISKDHATSHEEENTGDEMATNKEIEARKALRKTILAAMSDDSEVESVSRKEGFDHAKSEQYREEGNYKTKKGDLSDPDFDSMEFDNKIEIPNFTELVNGIMPDLGLNESMESVKFDGTPEDSEEFKLDFDPFEIPSQGNEELSDDLIIPTEHGKLPMKRTVASATLGNFDADAAEEVLAHALRTAGVEDKDLRTLTYAEGLELFKAIKTAGEDREHYTKDGVMNFPQNHPTDPDKRKAVTENNLRADSPKEEDPEASHERSGKELYSSSQEKYVAVLKKLMKSASDQESKESETSVTTPMGTTVTEGSSKEEELKKEAELQKARVKTAYSMVTKLVIAGILPANESESYADGMLSDGLTVGAMIKQTKLMLGTATANAERTAGSQAKANRTASTGISFNPSVRGDVSGTDFSGASDIQNALRHIGWSTPKVDTGMED